MCGYDMSYKSVVKSIGVIQGKDICIPKQSPDSILTNYNSFTHSFLRQSYQASDVSVTIVKVHVTCLMHAMVLCTWYRKVDEYHILHHSTLPTYLLRGL
jgi:hypothetical protein